MAGNWTLENVQKSCYMQCQFAMFVLDSFVLLFCLGGGGGVLMRLMKSHHV